MASPSTSPSTSATEALEVKRTIAASRKRVFEAWTQPARMREWFAPSAEYQVTAEVDLRVGGHFRITMKHGPSGNEHTAVGEYRELRAPEKLVCTWSWEGDDVQDTLLTVEFADLDGKTEITLRHERFASAEECDKHKQGWKGCLDRLTAATS